MMYLSLGVLLIPLILLFFAALPFVIALIYKGAYNRHLNIQMDTGSISKRWISPFALGMVIFLAEILVIASIIIIGVVNYIPRTAVEIDTSDNKSYTYEFGQKEAEDYSMFNGELVSNYATTEKTEGNFHYYAYKRMVDDDSMPDLAVYIEYIGDKDARSYMSSVMFGDRSGSAGFGNGDDIMTERRFIAVIDTSNVTVRNIANDEDDSDDSDAVPDYDLETSYQLQLFDLDMDDMDALSETDEPDDSDEVNGTNEADRANPDTAENHIIDTLNINFEDLPL